MVKWRHSAHYLMRNSRSLTLPVPSRLSVWTYDPTTATFVKTSLENRLRILSLFFVIIPRGPVTQKKGIRVGAEERGPHPTRVLTEMVEFIALPSPFSSKLKIWSFHVVIMQRLQRNVQKSVMHVQSCCFAHKFHCFFWRSRCRRRRSFVRSPLTKKARSMGARWVMGSCDPNRDNWEKSARRLPTG